MMAPSPDLSQLSVYGPENFSKVNIYILQFTKCLDFSELYVKLVVETILFECYCMEFNEFLIHLFLRIVLGQT